MPPHLESDDVDDIKTGTYVYWMKANEDVAEGVNLVKWFGLMTTAGGR